jgi:hypothetical protein
MSIRSKSGNPWTSRFSLAGTTAASLNYSAATGDGYAGVNTVILTSDTDVEITAKWGAAAPTTDGTAATPVEGYSYWIGPSHGPAVIACEDRQTSLGVYNLSASTAIIHAIGLYAAVG